MIGIAVLSFLRTNMDSEASLFFSTAIFRLVAATRPAEYKTPKHKRRIYFAIVFTWLFSICLALPLVTGFNERTNYFLLYEHHCGIYSPVYMFCSSIFAFYLPCLIM